MSSIVVAGNTSGSVTLAAPDVAGTTTLTLPTTTGTVVVANGAQTIEFADGSASAPSITNSGDTNTGMFFPAADTIAFAEGGTEVMRLDANGNVSITQTPGRYTVDTTGGATSIANNGTVDFANASGMLIVNNHNSGNVTVYLCGGGTTTSIGSVGTAVGTFTYVAGIAGYRWTNNSGSTATFGFFFVRTRTTA